MQTKYWSETKTPALKPVALIIDDDSDLRQTTGLILAKNYTVLEACNGAAGLNELKKTAVDVVLCDIRMPDLSGLEVLENIKKSLPQLEVIMLTAVSDAKTAVQALKKGAFDFLVKPVEPEQLLNTCAQAVKKKDLVLKNLALEAELEPARCTEILGESKVMQELFKKIQKIAKTTASVLITGETGTGKELAAHAIHAMGPRTAKPFIAVNCGGIPNELLETELFGHERGSFTSAEERKYGKFELAQGGTIFLDEIGNMPLLMQAKMLRVLQEKELERVGGVKPIPLNARFISATNEDLKICIQEKKFREDLYHRLKVVPLEIPPLRERHGDIVLLAKHFLTRYNKLYHGNFTKISPAALEVLEKYPWPGNVRELEHIIQRVITLEEGDTVLPEHLPEEFQPVKKKKARV
ncbi:DNA-binding transcriptional response regulator AtoC [Candidatus Termititenax aidoneus]|uniref:DNA-binding transcriptional response regulator AtoC n=1 Tax=Termititenax aidoneus TaxID=2218524 RepID=A0A388TCB4_TERA1|nr:DNA-binding transcriptional response regulator AtoC [Candidatus Termititenax aidoneus]